MKAYHTKPIRSGYKLAQLCQESDFHPSTVHYYVKIGLLHKPRKVGLGLYLYDDTHLSRLSVIRALRTRENLSLSKIKDRFQAEQTDVPSNQVRATEVPRVSTDTHPEVKSTRQAEATRQRLLDVATEFFSKKGYEGTTVSDITQAVQMSKGSFYLYFQDKRELFIDCIQRLSYLIVPEETWEEISREGDYTARQARRMTAFLEAFPSYSGILSMVKIAAMGEDPRLAHKAREAFDRILKPILCDFRRAVSQGMVRDVDEEFFAYVVLGMAENIGYKRMTDPDFDPRESVDKLVDLLAHGVLPRQETSEQTRNGEGRSGQITDVRGESVKVRELLFGGKTYLAGRIGEGEVRIETEKIAFLIMDHTVPECPAEVTMLDGKSSRLEPDGNTIISAASSVGLYTIPIRRVSSISFR
jgi:AcrR family transcriptional regulator